MNHRIPRLALLAILLAAAGVYAQDAKKCTVPPKECERQIRAMLTGKRYLGVQIEEVNPGLVIKVVVPDSPAEHADLRAGDRLIAVNGHYTTTATIRDFKQIMEGAKGSLFIIVQRHGMYKKIDARLEPYSEAQIEKIIAQHLAQSHTATAAATPNTPSQP